MMANERAEGSYTVIASVLICDIIDNKITKELPADLPLDPDTFARFKPDWKKYIGTYKYIMSGWKFDTLAKIALALGLTTEYTHVKVFEKDEYLYVDSQVYHGS